MVGVTDGVHIATALGLFSCEVFFPYLQFFKILSFLFGLVHFVCRPSLLHVFMFMSWLLILNHPTADASVLFYRHLLYLYHKKNQHKLAYHI